MVLIVTGQRVQRIKILVQFPIAYKSQCIRRNPFLPAQSLTIEIIPIVEEDRPLGTMPVVPHGILNARCILYIIIRVLLVLEKRVNADRLVLADPIFHAKKCAEPAKIS